MNQGPSSSSGGAAVGHRVLGRGRSRHADGDDDPAAAAADRENGEAIAACTSSIEAPRTHVAQGSLLQQETRRLLQEVRESVAQIAQGQTKIIETVKDQAKKCTLSVKQHFTKQLRRHLRPSGCGGGSEGATSLAARASERGQKTPEDMLPTFKTTTAATFKFPSNKVTPALTLWWLGAPAQGIPPLQLVENHCFKNKMTANTHSKLKTCARAVMDVLQLGREPATNMEVADALLRALPVLNEDTPQRRRNKNVAVSTLAGKIGKLVRENKKQGDADEVTRKRARHGCSVDSDDEAENDDEDEDADQANEEPT